MIFADKVIRLRKRNGWSQEELANKMDVSRQAVSKWEAAQTVPDIEKILKLASLFGVTTDYLLKDEIENEEYTGDGSEEAVKKVTLEQAGKYLEQRKEASSKIAAATFLCVLSPLTLIVLGVLSESGKIALSENAAGAIGLAVLFGLVAVAVAIFIMTGAKNAPFEFLEKEPFEVEYGVTGMVKERREAYKYEYTKRNVIGAVLCILSPVALFFGAFSEKDVLVAAMLCVTLAVAGAGAAFFISAGVCEAAMKRLLKEEEFSDAKKKSGRLTGTVSTVYWLSATAVYLVASFATEEWKRTWIIWAVAGVLYAAVMSVFRLIAERKE